MSKITKKLGKLYRDYYSKLNEGKNDLTVSFYTSHKRWIDNLVATMLHKAEYSAAKGSHYFELSEDDVRQAIPNSSSIVYDAFLFREIARAAQRILYKKDFICESSQPAWDSRVYYTLTWC